MEKELRELSKGPATHDDPEPSQRDGMARFTPLLLHHIDDDRLTAGQTGGASRVISGKHIK